MADTLSASANSAVVPVSRRRSPVALRIVLASGFAVHLVFAPAHPWGLQA
jgi:hypothetical protein